VDDSSKPQRFLGIDYAPAVNLYTEHDQFNNVDHTAGLSAGYAFSKLAIGLDQDFSHLSVKENEISDRVTRTDYDTRLRLRYELTDRSDVEVKGQYYAVDYEENGFDGYREIRNEDWFNHKFGEKLETGIGLGFGFVAPEAAPDQAFRQALVRGLYRLTGKLNLEASAGVEWRQYDTGQPDTFNPVVSPVGIYRPRETTVITVEAHRRETPSINGDYNYVTLGAGAGIRQQILARLYAGVTARYDNLDYVFLQPGVGNHRNDDYLSLQVSLEYEFSSHLKATLFYTRQQDDSNLSQFTYVNNMVGLRVSWGF
jgi:hypothetical protein